MTNKKIFCSSHPDVFCKKGVLKYLAKLTGKHVYRGLFQEKFQVVRLQLENRLMQSFFLSVTFSEQLFYSLVHT